jgi:hypothetical protein
MDARLGPGQVIGFFGGGGLQMRLQARLARGQGLRAVQGLGADLAHMVHPHQSGGFAALFIV